jgi:hypothetical protein
MCNFGWVINESTLTNLNIHEPDFCMCSDLCLLISIKAIESISDILLKCEMFDCLEEIHRKDEWCHAKGGVHCNILSYGKS